jgi:hypothetical protein
MPGLAPPETHAEAAGAAAKPDRPEHPAGSGRPASGDRLFDRDDLRPGRGIDGPLGPLTPALTKLP